MVGSRSLTDSASNLKSLKILRVPTRRGPPPIWVSDRVQPLGLQMQEWRVIDLAVCLVLGQVWGVGAGGGYGKFAES